jgi:hypothetical protein
MCAHNPSHNKRRITTILAALLSTLAVLMPTFRSMASTPEAQGYVEFKFNERTVWVDQPFQVNIDVVNAADWELPRIPEIDGMTSQVLPNPRSSTYTQIINGQVSSRTTQTYTIEFTPTRSGVIEIPPIEVMVDGKMFQSKAWKVVANTSEPGEFLLVEVVGIPGEGYVGQPIDLTLNIWVEVFRDRANRVTLSEGDMWSLVNAKSSQLGIFEEALLKLERQRKRPRGIETTRDDNVYYVYQLRMTRHPVMAGRIDPGDIRIVVNYPEGVGTQRDLFGRREFTLTGSRPISREASIEPLEIKPLPTEGRPENFTGAVGRFTVRANARPTDAAVGDPITLSYEITDENAQAPSDLANLRPPALRDVDALKEFRIPDDPTTGTVEGRVKVFTETLRPTEPTITEIPAIPFSFFDPSLERYVTVRSQPIPLSVSPSERLNLDAVLPSMEGVRRNSDGTPLTLVEGSLRANAPINQALLADHRPALGTGILVASIAPPIGFVAVMLWKRRQRLRLENPDMVRASQARRTASSHVSGKNKGPEDVFMALSGLISARMHLQEGTMTAREAVASARSGGLDEETLEELEALLRTCESSRYARTDSAGYEETDLAQRARVLLGPLDRLRPAKGERS